MFTRSTIADRRGLISRSRFCRAYPKIALPRPIHKKPTRGINWPDRQSCWTCEHSFTRSDKILTLWGAVEIVASLCRRIGRRITAQPYYHSEVRKQHGEHGIWDSAITLAAWDESREIAQNFKCFRDSRVAVETLQIGLWKRKVGSWAISRISAQRAHRKDAITSRVDLGKHIAIRKVRKAGCRLRAGTRSQWQVKKWKSCMGASPQVGIKRINE